MSHIIHVLDYKNELTAAGVTCPVEQSDLLVEPFTRAITRYFWMCDCNMSVDWEDRVWKQLEKWNGVSPIPAQKIMATFKVRMNVLRNSMLQKGGLPVYDEFVSTVTGANDTVVDVTTLASFDTLVGYLVKELGNCNE